MNDDKNLFGRVIALALLLGAAYGVESIAQGDSPCPLGNGSSCVMEIPAVAPAPAVNAKLEETDPVVPPPAPK